MKEIFGYFNTVNTITLSYTYYCQTNNAARYYINNSQITQQIGNAAIITVGSPQVSQLMQMVSRHPVYTYK